MKFLVLYFNKAKMAWVNHKSSLEIKDMKTENAKLGMYNRNPEVSELQKSILFANKNYQYHKNLPLREGLLSIFSIFSMWLWHIPYIGRISNCFKNL